MRIHLKSPNRSPRIIALILALALLSPWIEAGIIPLGEVGISEATSRAGKDPREPATRADGTEVLPMAIDATSQGEPLELGDATFERGVYSGSTTQSWTYELGGKFLSVFAYFGTPTGSPARRSAILEVHGDEELLFRSEPLERDEVKSLMLDVRGVNKLTFTSVPHNGSKTDSLIIGDPVLTQAPEANIRKADAEDYDQVQNNSAPEVKISAEPKQGRAPLTVDFDPAGSKDKDGDIMRYTWFFGDGEKDPLNFTTSHTYEQPGIYAATVVAEDNGGATGQATDFITVFPRENTAPRARFTASSWLIEPGEQVTLDASGSLDRDGQIEQFTWQMPDGSTSQGQTLEWQSPDPGIFMVTLKVTDNNGADDTMTRRVRVDDGSNSTVFPIRDGSRIMTIGNSLLGGLKNFLDVFAQSAEPPFALEFAGAGKGSGHVDQYVNWENLKVRQKIMTGGYDVVQIQTYRRPYEDEWQETFTPYLATLVEWIRESGAYPVVYMPHTSYSNQPEQQYVAHERVKQACEEIGAAYIPAGLAWAKVAEDNPRPPESSSQPQTVNGQYHSWLYNDGVHQSMTGQMLTAMVIWEFLTGQPATEMRLPEDWSAFFNKKHDILEEKIPYLREVAAEIGEPAPPLR